MTSGSRSVSLSSGKDLKYHQPHNSINSTASLRSSSIGSSFFTPNNTHGAGSNSSSSNDPSFLNGENTSANCTNSTESDDNELIEPTKDIDIVGAISTLHLDDDDEDEEATTTGTNNISRVKSGNKHNPQYGSLTPQNLAKTGSGNTKNTWNITQLAPPQPIRSSVSENGNHPNDQNVFVKPFELPESQEDASKKQTTNGLNLPLLEKILDSEGRTKDNDQNISSSKPQFYDGAIPFVPVNQNVTGNGNSQIPPPLGNIPPPMSNMPPPLPPHSMGLPSFSPFPHPSFYQGYIPSPPAHTLTPGDYQSFDKIPSVPSPAPPIIQESQVPTPAPVPVPALQPNQPQPPTMWNPLHSPLVRLPFGQQQLQTVYSPTQSTQLPLLPQQGPPQPQPAFPMMPQHNFHQHNQYHPRPHYRNNNGMMNVHRKNLRRKEDSAKYSDAKLQDFTGSILTLCKDQHGCRFLQRELINETNATLIFNEIYFKAVELMIDPFGNYLIQKLFTMINLEQRLVLINQCSNELFRIALDPHGTRSLQKLIDVIETNEEIEIITRNLYSNIVVLSRDLNGNHVVQKILTKFNTISSDSNSSDSNRDGAQHQNQNQFIFDIIQANLLYIACHRHGCCVLQRCLDYGNKQQCQQLSQEIAKHTIKLSLDPYGNYVVQYVLNKYSVGGDAQNTDNQVIDIIIQEIKSNFIQLSLHKFGSNVIEKCLKISLISKDLIDNLIVLDHGQAFNQLLNDPFGNYVLQTSLDVANLEQFEQLSKILLPLLPNIKSTPHGRRILNKIQQ